MGLKWDAMEYHVVCDRPTELFLNDSKDSNSIQQPTYVGIIIKKNSFDQSLVDTGMWLCQEWGSEPVYDFGKENMMGDQWKASDFAMIFGCTNLRLYRFGSIWFIQSVPYRRSNIFIQDADITSRPKNTLFQDVPRCAQSVGVLGYLGIPYGHRWTIPIGSITCLWHGSTPRNSCVKMM